MTIKTRVSFKEYVKLIFRLTYKKPMMKIIVCVALAMLVWITGYHFNMLPVPKPAYPQYMALIIITIIQPLVIYNTIWKNYHSGSHLKELLEIGVTQSKIQIRGESFYTELIWEKIYKVDELKDWFLIYQNTLSAVIIPKKSFLPGQVKEFKQILISIQNLTLHLKEP